MILLAVAIHELHTVERDIDVRVSESISIENTVGLRRSKVFLLSVFHSQWFIDLTGEPQAVKKN